MSKNVPFSYDKDCGNNCGNAMRWGLRGRYQKGAKATSTTTNLANQHPCRVVLVVNKKKQR